MVTEEEVEERAVDMTAKEESIKNAVLSSQEDLKTFIRGSLACTS